MDKAMIDDINIAILTTPSPIPSQPLTIKLIHKRKRLRKANINGKSNCFPILLKRNDMKTSIVVVTIIKTNKSNILVKPHFSYLIFDYKN